MYEFLVGYLFLGLTTGLTCAITLFPSIIGAAKARNPKCLAATSTTFAVSAHITCLIFSAVLFPAFLVILFVETANENFTEFLGQRFSQI